MSTFSPIPAIKKEVRFAEYVKIKIIPALETTKPYPKKYYKTSGNKKNNTHNSLLKPTPSFHPKGIRKFMLMIFR